MEESNKLWVINLADECGAEEPQVTPPEIRRNPPRPTTPIKRAVPRVLVRRKTRTTGRLHFAPKMVLSYILGPFAMLLWTEGGNVSLWSFISIFSGIGSIAIAWKWRSILALDSSGSLLIPLLVWSGIISLLAFTSWARALQLAFASRTRSHTSWPAWMRSSWMVTGLGFLAPGLGLYLAGSYRRAAATVWSFWPVFLAAVILAHAGWTWQWLQISQHTADSKEMYENLMMVAVGIVLLGFGGWLVQALSGLHILTRLSPAASGVNGDRYAMALLVAVVALSVLSPSADMASFINKAGVRLHQEGFRTIPLQLARSAHALDPGEITYSLQVAAMHRERGETEAADSVQQNLDQNFQVYLGMLGRQETQSESLPSSVKNPHQAISKKPEPALDPETESWTKSTTFGLQLNSPESPEIR